MKKILLLISIALVLSINLYFRAFPVGFPQLKTQARYIVEEEISHLAGEEVNKNFPEFGKLAKERLIQALVSDYKKEKSQVVENRIQQQYLNLKDKYQDQKGQTYLMELDCWQWARYVENILRFGHPEDKIIANRHFDSLLCVPSEGYFPWNKLLFYLSSFLYRFFSLFKPVPLFTFLFFLPLFFTAVFILVLYLVCYYIKGHLNAFISCLFVGLAPIFLSRSCAGWFDTDVLNLFFPLLIVCSYLMVYHTVSYKKIAFGDNLKMRFSVVRKVFYTFLYHKKAFLWIFLSTFFVGLFSFTWLYWWFISCIIIIYEFFSLANLFFIYTEDKKERALLFKRHLFSLVLFVFLGLIWVIVFSGVEPLSSLYFQLKRALFLNKPLIASIWPNVYSTVGEFKKANFLEVANAAGGLFWFISSLFFLLLLFFQNRKYSGFRREVIVLFVFWFLTMSFACSRGIRFVIFLLIPLGIPLGWAITETYEYFKNKKKILTVSLAIPLFIFLNIGLLNNGYNTAKTIFPLMDDTWYGLLVNLRESTPQEAVINSWWDFGDWFKTVSRRRVIFDGQNQNSPRAYWMANVLLNDNAEEALRTLEMLNNGSDQAFAIIDSYFKDPFKSIIFLKKIISAGKEGISQDKDLYKAIPPALIDEVTKLVFKKPDSAYFVVDYTMPDKILSLSFLGNWDFLKVYLAKNLKKTKEELINYLTPLGIDKEKIERLSKELSLVSSEHLGDWISPRFNFYSKLTKGSDKNGVILFERGWVYHPKEKTVYIYDTHNGDKFKIPKSLFIFENAKLEEIVYPENNLDFSILIFKEKEEFRGILLDRELANSLFVRLYFLNGFGLKNFRPFLEAKDGDNYIRVFTIDWD